MAGKGTDSERLGYCIIIDVDSVGISDPLRIYMACCVCRGTNFLSDINCKLTARDRCVVILV